MEFINSLFIELVGTLRYSPQVFYNLEPKECLQIIEKAKFKEEYDHRLMYIAIRNAIGTCMSKKYKYFDVFEKEKPQRKKEVTQEEREKLKEYFESW